MDFKLRCDERDLPYWSGRYSYPLEEALETQIAPRARELGYFTKPDFLYLCRWKTPRTQAHCNRNSAEYIEAVTRAALTTQSEQLRIEVLTLLRGVNWPTASVILHFAHTEPYPILDFRALWSLGVNVPAQYTYEYWWSYTQACRSIAERTGLTMRELDRALWQFSKENQL